MSKERNMGEIQPDPALTNEVTTDEASEVTSIPEGTEASAEQTDPNT